MKKRNKFSLSHYKLLTARMGQLLPISIYEVLPGDTVQQNTSLFIRMAAMVTPVMHPLKIRIHHWYVPFRLIWDDFEDFITGGADGLDDTIPPYQDGTNISFAPGTLADYLGLPVNPVGAPPKYSVLPFRAYANIYNEWYRDQDLEEEVVFSKASGLDTTTSRALQMADWERDYFTTARPWPQKGSQVTVPLSGAGQSIVTSNKQPTLIAYRDDTNPPYTGAERIMCQTVGSSNSRIMNTYSTTQPQAPIGDYYLKWGTETGMQLGGSAGIDVNALREAFALQRFEEHRAMYGSRYTEYLRYLGVKASDARLQRPEYLGGGSSTIQFSEVLQSSPGGNPVGTLRGHGIGAMRSNRFRRFIEEHGYVITLMSAIPRSIYMQGVPRLWSRETKEDFWQKELEHIGQQEVYTDELYAAYNADGSRIVFGYQNRYDDYREIQSSVCGEFRNTEKYWHLARDFTAPPVLNASFLSANPSPRIFADPGTESRQAQQMYIMANHSIQARRLLSRNGNPI
ncbi:phage major capsid protein [Candidatus Termititenax persephonae]|uniref:Phage major capsid protein n=1 Tax=Candidatus Termititenax persephonae TaxID=2218525 RepID=A0A388TJC3_9BACT|nr:phage major capsid protein [Candidatus Termititenax persephonae]